MEEKEGNEKRKMQKKIKTMKIKRVKKGELRWREELRRKEGLRK